MQISAPKQMGPGGEGSIPTALGREAGSFPLSPAVCLALLFAGYRLWLRSETLHGMNRATLLGICVASFVLPALGGAWMRLVGLPSSGGIDVGAVLVATAEAVPATWRGEAPPESEVGKS